MKVKKRFLSILLSLAMMLGMLSGMSLTAYADTNYDDYIPSEWDDEDDLAEKVVNFNGHKWYIISDDGETITLLAADTSFGIARFTDGNDNSYIQSKISETLDGMTAKGGSFADVADAIEEINLSETGGTAKLYLLNVDEVSGLPNNVIKMNFTGGDASYGQWWLRSPDPDESGNSMCVYVKEALNDYEELVETVIKESKFVEHYFGVRPALKLNLSKVAFNSTTNTFTVEETASYSVTVTAGSNMTKTETSGAASQTGLTGAMTDVVYTANDGYYFPEDYSVTAVNGISVTRDSYTQITVSGTPTADATIALTAPTEKSKEATPTATFTVTGAYEGTLSGVANGMKYSLDGGTTWTDVSSDANIELTGLSGCTIQVVKKGGNTTADSDPQEITVAQASKPAAAAVHCTSKANNDGKLIGVTTAMEYKKSDAENWTDGTGSDITGLLPGTYFVRVKVTDTALASENQALTIEPFERTNPFEGRVYNIGDVLYLSNYCYVNYKDGNNRNIYWTAKTADASYYYGKTYHIPTPTWNESKKYWTFPDFTLIYYEGEWYNCSFWLGQTDNANGGEIVTGVKCTGGDGSAENPYTFVLVFEPRPEASATGYSGAYDGASHGITVSVTDPTSGTTVKYGTTEGTYNLDTSPEYTDAGKYTVYYEVKAEGRSTLRGSADINIAKADVTVTAKNQNIHVNGTVPDLSSPVQGTHYTVTGLVGEDVLTTTPTLDYQKDGEAATPDNTTAGTYDIVASGASAGDNYDISYTNGTLTISEKPSATVKKAPTAKTLTYDGSAQELVTAGEAEGGTMQYAIGTKDAATEPYTTSIPTATDAGTYYVWYMVKGDNNHNDTKPASVKVSIAKRRVTLTSGTGTKVYDGKALKNNKVTVSGDGWAKGEGATYKVTGSQTKVGKSNNKFSYTLKSGTDAKNYNIVTKTGTLTVTEPVVRGTFIHIKSITQKNNKLQINWTKVGQADGYDVYVQYCTKNFADPVETIKKNATTQLTIAKLNGTKIDLTKAFKIYVVAYKMVNGKKTVLAKTVTSHVAGVKNAKYTNQKALKLTKSAFDIKTGKTAKIKVSATLMDGKKKIIPKDHGAAFKFRSSNTRVATVDKDGKITAKKTGKCYIFVYGISGLMKKVTVTVK